MQEFFLKPNGALPNHPRLAARRYPLALPGQDAAQVRAYLKTRGWTGTWRGQIYNYHHYHSHAHEVLVVLSGSAQVVLGGAGGPELTVQPGDVLLLPAGVGHCSRHHSPDFEVLGAYAAGRDWDICTPEKTDLAWAQARIRKSAARRRWKTASASWTPCRVRTWCSSPRAWAVAPVPALRRWWHSWPRKWAS